MFTEMLIAVTIGIIYQICHLFRKPPPIWERENNNKHHPSNRRLGKMETAFAQIGQMGFGNISAIIFIRSKYTLTEAIVTRALVTLSQRHPLLCMRLMKENGQFTYMKEMKDTQIDLEVCHTDDWLALMEKQQLFDSETGPLWNVKYIPDPSYDDGQQDGFPHQAACVFTFHHAVTDGPSFFRLFGEFVDRLHEILDNDKPIVETESLLPPVDAYIDAAPIYSLGYNFKANMMIILGMITWFPKLLSLILKMVIKSPLFIKNHGAEIERDPDILRRTCFIPKELTQKQTSQLLASCKRHNTTVQAAIQTAASLAYVEVAGEGNLKQTHRIGCRLSCDIRRFLAADELKEYCGLYVSLFMMYTKISPSLLFWDMVSLVTADLRAKLKSHEPCLYFTQAVNVLNGKDGWEEFNNASASLPGQRDLDLSFNNYGNYNMLNRDDTRNVKISGYFGGAHEHGGGSVFGSNLATLNGKLSWTFQYYPHVCNKEQAERYADFTIRTLLEAIKE